MVESKAARRAREVKVEAPLSCVAVADVVDDVVDCGSLGAWRL
jgi:hypothetical protein